MPDHKKQNRILILFAHPSQHKSEINVPLYTASQQIDKVTLVDLYAEYPTFRIDIDREQERLVAHDIIVFMFPLYWYSTPALLKEWQDLVLEYGFAYGSKGKALHGKSFLCAVSAGGAEQTFSAEGNNHYTIRELLHPLEQTAVLTGMRYLPPFTLFGARTAVEEGRVKYHVEHWQQVLIALRDNHLDLNKAERLAKLNDSLVPLDEQRSGEAS